MVVESNYDPKGLIIENGGEFILPYDESMELAKQAGFCKRLRVIHPVIFVLTLLTHRSAHSVPTIRELWQNYVKISGFNDFDPSLVIKYASFYNKFNAELVLYLKSILNSTMIRLEERSNLQLKEKLKDFKSIYIQDNTVVRLHDKLASLFPAARTRKPGKSAGLKVSVLYNAVAHGPSTVSVVPERTHDIKTVKIGEWIKGRLLILDLGFYKHWNFDKITHFGGSFLVRLKSNAKPKVNKIILPTPDEKYNELRGLSVHDVLARLPHTPVVMEVTISFRRRKYRNKVGKIDSGQYYCFADFNHSTKKWHVYLTNLSPDDFTVEEICALYGFRWTIEMLFKEMKSDNELGQKKSVNQHLSESLIYVALIRTTISREFYLLVIKHVSLGARDRIHPLLWSRIFLEHLHEMASILRLEFESGVWLNEMWQDLLPVIAGNCIPIKRARSRLLDPLQ